MVDLENHTATPATGPNFGLEVSTSTTLDHNLNNSPAQNRQQHTRRHAPVTLIRPYNFGQRNFRWDEMIEMIDFVLQGPTCMIGTKVSLPFRSVPFRFVPFRSVPMAAARVSVGSLPAHDDDVYP